MLSGGNGLKLTPSLGRASVLQFNGIDCGAPVIDSMTDSDSEEHLPTMLPECEVAEPEELVECRISAESFNPKQPSTSRMAHAAVHEDDSSRDSITNHHDHHNFGGKKNRIEAKPQRRRTAYRKSESKNERRNRKERLQRALRDRTEQLESMRNASATHFDPENKIENVLTRNLLLLSGDRHGPFVGRPR